MRSWRIGCSTCWKPRASVSAKSWPISTLRRIDVVLYSPEQFKTVTRLPAWAVGIYDGRIKVPLGGTSASADDLERVLEHELVHAIVAAIAGPTVPAWLNEGLATALERDGTEWAEELRCRALRHRRWRNSRADSAT